MGTVIYKYLSDPNWLLAVFTLILVIVAILTLLAQTKSFKLTIGADLAMKFDERFNEPAFLADRVHAAEALKSQLNLKEAENVFDFLDMVGLFVRLKALDPASRGFSTLLWSLMCVGAGPPRLFPGAACSRVAFGIH